MKKQVFLLTALLIGLMATATVQAQEVKVRPQKKDISPGSFETRASPMSVSFAKKGDTYVKIVYSRPQLNGRKMLGKQVSFGDVWRLGANEATEITTTSDIEINGNTLNAGTYSVFAIPGKKEWTLIFNSAVGEWGAYNYDKAKDVFRTTVSVEGPEQEYEALTIWFENDGSAMNIAWNNSMVSLPIEL